MDAGYTGLANLGNTCFLNACIQALNHTVELTQLREKYTPFICQERKDAIIIREYEELRDIMMNNNGVVTPSKFIHNVHLIAREKGRDIFTGWAQNDMPEFLLFMIECMHNSISRGIKVAITKERENMTAIDELAIHCYDVLKSIYMKEYSEIMDLFYGIYVSEIWTTDGKTRHSHKAETFFILDIPIPQKTDQITLYDCFDTFTEVEHIQGENAWFNEKTQQKEDIRKNITFWSFPNILVITLKRFSPDGQSKRNGLIDFPINGLDLSKYVSGYNARTYIYDLYAVCNHIGGVQGGHYTAFAKRTDGSWNHFNDTHVEKMLNPQDVVTPMAYCLFYRKKNDAI
jgi:ubiquitin carboxyl-terminal hydrolase 8